MPNNSISVAAAGTPITNPHWWNRLLHLHGGGAPSAHFAQLAKHLLHKLVHSLESDPAKHSKEKLSWIGWLLDELRKWVHHEVAHLLETHTDIRRIFIMLDYAATHLRGILADGLLLPGGFAKINDEDWKEWLAAKGLHQRNEQPQTPRGSCHVARYRTRNPRWNSYPLCQIFRDDRLYNGYPVEKVTAHGAKELGIEAWRDGITSRGVLLDVPWLRDAPWLDPSEATSGPARRRPACASPRATCCLYGPGAGRIAPSTAPGTPTTAWRGCKPPACPGSTSAVSRPSAETGSRTSRPPGSKECGCRSTRSPSRPSDFRCWTISISSGSPPRASKRRNGRSCSPSRPS